MLSDVEHELDAAGRAGEGGPRARAAGAAGGRAALVRRGLPARAARVADRHRPGRPHVPRRRGRVDRGRDQAHRHDRGGRAARRATWSASGSTPRSASCRGVLAAQTIKPQARVLAHARGIDCVEVDLEVLRGEREPDAHAVRRLSAGARLRRRVPAAAGARRRHRRRRIGCRPPDQGARRCPTIRPPSSPSAAATCC